MKLATVFLLLCSMASAQRYAFYGANQRREIWSQGYWAAVGSVITPIANIEWRGLTHVLFTSAIPFGNGTLDVSTGEVTANAAALVAAAHANNVKALITLYQANFAGHAQSDFHDAITNNRTTFNNNIMALVNQYGFDGVDLNWESYNGDELLLFQLMTDLRALLGPQRILVTAVPVDNQANRDFWASHHGPLDRLNIETYDAPNNCNSVYTWHHTPIFDNGDNAQWSVELARSRYLAAGVPREKFGFGMSFQGTQSVGGTPTLNGPNITCSALPTSFSQVNYYDIKPQIGVNGTFVYDNAAQAPYLRGNSGANSWLTYENETSIAAKLAYVKSNHLGGFIIWNICTDYLPAQTPKNPLLDAVRLNLR